MYVEITATAILERRYIQIDAIDISETQLMRLERCDPGNEQEITFLFDSKDPKAGDYIFRWLRRHKSREATTLGESLHSIVGRVCTISGKYRSWDY